MFDDSRKKVDLRGKSKKDDRQSVLARAAREREERSRQRQRQAAALIMQAAVRGRREMSGLRAALRPAFDTLVAQTDVTAFAQHASRLTSLLLRFHQHSEPLDALRRGRLLSLFL